MKKIKTLLTLISGAGLLLPLLAMNQAVPQSEKDFSNTALLIIDIQNFYFKDGKLPLVGSIEASLQAKKILEIFRAKKLPVIHVRHIPLKAETAATDPAYAIQLNVAPAAGEKIITKHYANSFRETELLEYLKKSSIKRLVICGMQTQMCVEAAVRAAADYGFDVILPCDACATRSLSFNGTEIPAGQVQAAVLATLNGTYARVVKADELIAELR